MSGVPADGASAGAISVSKDSLGIQGVLRDSSCYHPRQPSTGHRLYDLPCGYQVWSGELVGGSAAVVLANLESAAAGQSITLTAAHLPPAVDDRTNGGRWTIKDAYTGVVRCQECTLPQTVLVGPHDVAFWLLTQPHTATYV